MKPPIFVDILMNDEEGTRIKVRIGGWILEDGIKIVFILFKSVLLITTIFRLKWQVGNQENSHFQMVCHQKTRWTDRPRLRMIIWIFMYLVTSLVVNQLKPNHQRKQLRQRKRPLPRELPQLKERLQLKRQQPRRKLPQQHVEQKDQDHQKRPQKNQKNVSIGY